jgi:hypothetical protein
MTEDQVVGLFVQGGIGATALAILGKIALKVADRMISAIDALSKEARDTGKATVDALSSLTERLSRLEGKVEVLASGDTTGPVQHQWPDNEISEVRRMRARSPDPSVEGSYGPIKPRR